ncbi:hypothetical protein LOAG_01061 [Loa loa]|uniref:Uncharacterized protein n=1 Tax=Loa loa TaxID=7209 RepID=A0A1S0UBV9_LOALO|nr:hypothetical protein LOAG_01061 [Loa loa]EFO27425.1 hypothetical protein LOAG_01061 [Loa loa]
MEEKRVIQLQLCGINERRSNLLKSIREITNQLDNTDRYIRQQRRDFLQLKDNLCDLHAKKKKLVDSYNKKRTEYIDWSNRNKKDMQCSSIICLNYPYPATYPAAHRHQSSADFIDEETLEPFYEQKMACKRLIEYLTSLQSRMSMGCPSSAYDTTDKTCRQMTADGSEDSAEEYPPSFSSLKTHSSLPVRTTVEQELGKETSLINILKKKNCKKIFEETVSETEIPIPQTYREIENTLNMVRILLKQYQEQTNVIIWDESDYGQLPSLSESEHTADSTWNGSTDTSDRGSVFNIHTCSSFDLTTPVQERPESFATDLCSQKLEFAALLSISDEGFASKNSTH